MAAARAHCQILSFQSVYEFQKRMERIIVKEKNGSLQKRIFCGLTALATAAMVFPATAMAANDSVNLDKVAQNWDGQSTDVTLSIGATQGEENVAVLFVLDYSTSVSVRSAAADMLDELKTKENTNVKVGVVNYWSEADDGEWVTLDSNTNTDNLLAVTQTGGTNLHAGFLEAQDMLSDSEIAGYTTYLITISDGITYLWTDETTGETMSAWYLQPANGEYSIQNSNDVYTMKYGNRQIDSATFLDIVTGGTTTLEKYQNTEKYFVTYDKTASAPELEGNATDGYDSQNYVNLKNSELMNSTLINNEIALCKTATTYSEVIRSVDNAYAFALDENHWSSYPYGKQLMDYLASISDGGAITEDTAAETFAGIRDQILYEIQSGTVTDTVGSYFDLNDLGSMYLTVGSNIHTGSVSGNTVSFETDSTHEGYEYVVTYHPEEESGEEYLTWDINVPVESANGISLTYTLDLDESLVETAIEQGILADGSEIPTNEEAVLEYTPTDGGTETKEFPVPKVEIGGGIVEPDPDPGKESEPGMDKKADGSDEIGYVQAGDSIDFTLNSNLPSELYGRVTWDGNKWVAEDGVPVSITFHDSMSDNLTVTDASLQVWIEGNTTPLDINLYGYTLDADGHGFTVDLDIMALLNYGVIDEYDLLNASEIRVTYSAVVSENASDGEEVLNEAWVDWNGESSESDKTPGEVGGDTPETGGTGTTLFTIGGGAMLAAAGTLFVISRRKGSR